MIVREILEGNYLQMQFQRLDCGWVISRLYGSWRGVDQVESKTDPRYKPSEDVQLFSQVLWYVFVLESTPWILHRLHNGNHIFRVLESYHHIIGKLVSKYTKIRLKVHISVLKLRIAPTLESFPVELLLLVSIWWAFILSCPLDWLLLPLDSVLLLLFDLPPLFLVVGLLALSPLVCPPCASLIFCSYVVFILPSSKFSYCLNVRKLVPTNLYKILLQRCLKSEKVKDWTYLSIYLR